MNSPITVEKGAPQLFVDDLLIASQENLKRTLHQPKKDNGGNFPILQLPPDFFGDIPGTLMANGTIVYDPKINRYVMFALALDIALVLSYIIFDNNTANIAIGSDDWQKGQNMFFGFPVMARKVH